MSYFNTSGNWSDNSLSSLRSSDGKVLGRVRMEVKGSTPQAGMKDYRFCRSGVFTSTIFFRKFKVWIYRVHESHRAWF